MPRYSVGPTIAGPAPPGAPADAARKRLAALATPTTPKLVDTGVEYPPVITGWTETDARGAWYDGEQTITETVVVFSVTVGDDATARYVAGALAATLFAAYENAVYMTVGGHGAIVPRPETTARAWSPTAADAAAALLAIARNDR